MAAESAARETNDTTILGYKMKITLMKRFWLFCFDEESYNVQKLNFHKNPRWPPKWPLVKQMS